MTKTVVVLYDDVALAQETVDDLVAAGMSRDDISLVSTETVAAMPGAVSRTESELTGSVDNTWAAGSDLVQRLTDLGVPRDEAEAYAEGTRRGGGLVIVRTDDAGADDVVDIMRRRPAVDYETRAALWRREGWTGYDASAAPYTSDQIAEERRRYAEWEEAPVAGGTGLRESAAPEFRESERELQEGEEARIPVVEEQVKIGKRDVRRRGVRIHTWIEEKPVEETVRLRDEEVRVERRPVDRPVSADEAETAFREGTIEVEEVDEEPVVSKEARVVEEVAISKDVHEHEETVHDTVRYTQVDFEEVDCSQSDACKTEDGSRGSGPGGLKSI